jgi:hypothetical protein
MLPIRTPATTESPHKLFIFSTPKVGKTTLLESLPNCLIVDTENGTNYIEGIKYNVKKVAMETGKGEAKVIRELAEEIKKKNKEINGYVYDYIAIDTVTGLEEVARTMATLLYKQTPLGKNYNGNDVVVDLPMGAGYGYLRNAFTTLYGYFDGLSKHGLVMMGHVKFSSIIKEGKELAATDIDLTGRLKQIMCSDSDAIGVLYRAKENPNQVIISFETNERDLATGARSKHLRQQKFVISELVDDKVITHWDKIYLHLK